MGRCARGLLLCAAVAAARDNANDPRDVLHRVAEAYLAVQGYRAQALVTSRPNVQNQISIAYGAPNLLLLVNEPRGEATAFYGHSMAGPTGNPSKSGAIQITVRTPGHSLFETILLRPLGLPRDVSTGGPTRWTDAERRTRAPSEAASGQ